MPTLREKVSRSFDVKQALLEAYAVNERMNQMLLAATDSRLWRAEVPGGTRRTIAATFAHIHNARCMWLKVSGKGMKIPPHLDRQRATKNQVAAALVKSAAVMVKLLRAGLEHPDGRVKNFRPDAAHFVAYMIAYDAHHCGQIMMLYRQLGFRFPIDVAYGIWNWSKLWQQVVGVRRSLN